MWADLAQVVACVGRGLTAHAVNANNYTFPVMAKKSKPRRVGRARTIPLAKRMDVSRAEFNRVIAILNERGNIINDLRHNQDMQFRRLAQLQAELDLIRRGWERSGQRSSE
jgi:hypothetical protein